MIIVVAIVIIASASALGYLDFRIVHHSCVQVSYLKDTISRKDMEIEQLLKDKSKSPSSSTDRNDSSQQIRRLSGNGSLRSCYRISSCPQNYAVVNGISNGHTSPTGTGAAGSGEAECEDNVSDDGCSVAGTEYSVGGASEAAAEQMYVVTVAF